MNTSAHFRALFGATFLSSQEKREHALEKERKRLNKLSNKIIKQLVKSYERGAKRPFSEPCFVGNILDLLNAKGLGAEQNGRHSDYRVTATPAAIESYLKKLN